MAQGHHLVEDAAEGPNIGLLIVGLLLADFWREIVRSSNSCLRTVVSVLEHTSDTEVANFD